jgi:hypothetical protein
MPIYDACCRSGHITKNVLGTAGDENLGTCHCGADRRKIWLKPPAMEMDYGEYECPVTGRQIRGRQQHLENLRRTGCHIFEPGEREEAERAQAKMNDKMWDANEATVDRIFGEIASN